MTFWLILLMITAMAAGFILALLIFGFGNGPDGTMYFYTDNEDGKEYTFAQFDAQNVSEIDHKKSITLKCVKLPPDFSMSQENQGI